jgi:hypothetical protein
MTEWSFSKMEGEAAAGIPAGRQDAEDAWEHSSQRGLRLVSGSIKEPPSLPQFGRITINLLYKALRHKAREGLREHWGQSLNSTVCVQYEMVAADVKGASRPGSPLCILMVEFKL